MFLIELNEMCLAASNERNAHRPMQLPLVETRK